ncbi:MAG: DUF2920 family protein [Synergistaceae bacterium]|nr:DUF2920 family protein [Synergistaceae bacterium]
MNTEYNSGNLPQSENSSLQPSATVGESDEKVYSIPGHTLEFEEDFERNIDIFIKEPSNGVNENTGYFLILHPGTASADSWYYQRLREEWSDRYNVVAIGVNYLGTINRTFYYTARPKWTKECLDTLYSLLSWEQQSELTGSGRYDVDTMCNMLPNYNATKLLKLPEEIQHRERTDYRDYGYIQTMDCLYAIKHAMNLCDEKKLITNKNRVFVYGNCFGGHLAQICAKFAPSTFCLVVDNSGFVEMTKHFLDTVPINGVYKHKSGFACTLVREPYYSDDPKSKYFLHRDMIDIRNMTIPRHLKVFSEYFKGKIIMFHGENDNTIKIKSRIRMHELYDSAGIDNYLRVFTEKDIDGQIIKSSGHGMDADIKLLFEKYCDKYVLENSETAVVKDVPSDYERESIIKYPGLIFYYLIDYTDNFPAIHFIKL